MTIARTEAHLAEVAAPQRVRHQARDAALVMGFSAAVSVACAVLLLLITLLGR